MVTAIYSGLKIQFSTPVKASYSPKEFAVFPRFQ